MAFFLLNLYVIYCGKHIGMHTKIIPHDIDDNYNAEENRRCVCYCLSCYLVYFPNLKYFLSFYILLTNEKLSKNLRSHKNDVYSLGLPRAKLHQIPLFHNVNINISLSSTAAYNTNMNIRISPI
jgi:hypothetical protein